MENFLSLSIFYMPVSHLYINEGCARFAAFLTYSKHYMSERLLNNPLLKYIKDMREAFHSSFNSTHTHTHILSLDFHQRMRFRLCYDDIFPKLSLTLNFIFHIIIITHVVLCVVCKQTRRLTLNWIFFH